MKKYFYNKIQKFILYFISEYIEEFSIKPLHNKIDIQRKEIVNFRFDLSMLLKQENINDKNIKDLFKIIDKLSKDSITAWLDISSCKKDNTSIVILSRIKWKERIEFIERKFNNIWEIENFIKSIKKSDENIYIDNIFNI